MKNREIYAEMRCISPVIVRADGRNFKNTLLNLDIKKPYDERFARAMADTAELFIKKSGISPLFAYIFSDEVNLLFLDLPFGGRVEKIDSVTASYLGSAFTLSLGLEEPLAFDARVVALQKEEIQEYLHWRQLEAWHNCVFSYGYYALRKEGMGGAKASKFLRRKRERDIHELLFERGTNLATVPAWQRRGILIYRTDYEISGFNPVLGRETGSLRTKIIQNWDIPKFKSEEGKALLEKLINRN